MRHLCNDLGMNTPDVELLVSRPLQGKYQGWTVTALGPSHRYTKYLTTTIFAPRACLCGCPELPRWVASLSDDPCATWGSTSLEDLLSPLPAKTRDALLLAVSRG